VCGVEDFVLGASLPPTARRRETDGEEKRREERKEHPMGPATVWARRSIAGKQKRGESKIKSTYYSIRLFPANRIIPISAPTLYKRA
jgi:hypothetical protein